MPDRAAELAPMVEEFLRGAGASPSK